MYAVVLTGGKQYRVTAGDVIQVEKLAGDAGDKITFEQILSLSGDRTLIGTPHVSGASVTAQVIGQDKADKVLIFKKKRRHNYRRKNGHRQRLTTLFITGVAFEGKALATAEAKQHKRREEKAAHAASLAAPKAPKSEKKAAAPKAAKPAAKKPAAPKKEAAAKKPAAKKAAK